MTIRTRLFSGFGVLLVLIVVFSIMTISIFSIIDGFVGESNTRSNDALLIEESVWMTHRLYSIFADARINADLVSSQKEFDEFSVYFNKRLVEVKNVLDTEEELDNFKIVESVADDILDLFPLWVNFIKSGDDVRVKELDAEIDRLRDGYVDTMKMIEEDLKAELKEAAETLRNMVKKVMTFIVLISIISVISGLIISYFIGKSIIKPVVIATSMLKDISEGEGDLTKTLEVGTKDEIAEMAGYFNSTILKIKNLIDVVKKQTFNLQEIGVTLSSNMNETSVAVNEISANIQGIKNQSVNQSSSVTETSATMQQVVKGIEKLNNLIENQSANVTESSTAIEEMMANIGSVTQTLIKNAENITKLISSSSEGRTYLNKIATDIQQVAKESEGLLEISKVIQNIASQTNLLAMNAAIEAAHAGESGQGFAVVADEVRNLAESSGKQAKTVATVLNSIKNSIETITHSTEDVIERFDIIETEIQVVNNQENSIRAAMEEQTAGSKQVLEAISQLNDITEEVKASSSEMLIGSKQVIDETTNLNAITQEITNGMNEMASGTNQITTAVNTVNDLSENNKSSIDALAGEVGKFKTE